MKQNNAELALLVARAALEAGDYKAAREAAESAARMQPREGAFLLLADIEEAESGDQGRVRQYLSKAVRAPRDPAWVADGFVSDAVGAGVAGYRPHRRVRVARAGRAARPADRAGCRFAEPASRAGADSRPGAAKDADEVADILDVADLAPESAAGRRRNPRQPRRLSIRANANGPLQQAVESEGETPPPT